MKRSDTLKFVDPGTLGRPGPIGRLLRLALGAACLYANYQLAGFSGSVVATPITVLPNLALMIVVALCVFNYVVNIGFGRNWHRWPLIAAVVVLASLAATSRLVFGTADHWLPGIVLWLWLMYLFAHLGVSFVLAAVIGTPGCEMRAIPELIGRLGGKPVAEHACPATFITAVDKWEQGRR